MPDRTAPSTMAELVQTLWYECRLLEFLLYRLVSANLLWSAGGPFVGPVEHEVEQVLARVRRAQADRSRVVHRLAHEWGEPVAELTLDELAGRADPPVSRQLHDCRLVLGRLVDEIDRVARANRRLATVDLGGSRAALGIGEPSTYTPAAPGAQQSSVSGIFTVLEELETLLTTDVTGFDSSMSTVAAARDTILESLATLGSAARRVEDAPFEVMADIELVHSEVSDVEDVDPSEALLELSLDETAYQAAMAAFTRARQPSLVDFLR